MRITIKSLQTFGTLYAIALVVAVAGCRSSSDRTTGQAINDKMLQLHIDHALSSDPVLKFPDVKVHVYTGNAQLSGFVTSDEQRTKAAEIAASVPGVSQVINEIAIKPTPTGRAVIRDPLNGDDRNLTPSSNPPPEPQPR